MAEKWIQKAIKRPGAMRARHGKKAGEKLTSAEITSDTKSKNPRVRRQAHLARTLRKIGRRSSSRR